MLASVCRSCRDRDSGRHQPADLLVLNKHVAPHATKLQHLPKVNCCSWLTQRLRRCLQQCGVCQLLLAEAKTAGRNSQLLLILFDCTSMRCHVRMSCCTCLTVTAAVFVSKKTVSAPMWGVSFAADRDCRKVQPTGVIVLYKHVAPYTNRQLYLPDGEHLNF